VFLLVLLTCIAGPVLTELFCKRIVAAEAPAGPSASAIRKAG
jgi:hypothetical protein